MRTSIRLLVVLCVSVAALMSANAAWAVYEPNLRVATISNSLNTPSILVVGIAQTPSDDATAKLDIFVPEGFNEQLTATPGTTIGAVSGAVIARNLGNAEIEFQGVVRADNPATYLNNPCTRQPTPHGAVWVLEVTIAGTPFRVPIYVDNVTTIPGVSARMQVCLAGPVGTPNGTQVLRAAFAVQGVFQNPPTRGVYTFSGLFTPYVAGSATPNPVGTVESRAIVPLPVSVTLRTQRRGRRVIVSGRINIPGNALPATVELWTGPTARRLRRVARLRVRANATFTTTRRYSRRTRIQFFQVRINNGFADASGAPFNACASPPSRAPAGCVSAWFTALDVRSSVRRVRFPRR
jgi:hypothetical protein